MREILVLGRGGQGAVTSTQVLAIAAFKDGKHSLAFPNFGVERMGAPVKSYCRIDDNPITLREQVQEADYAIILDPTLTRHFHEKVKKMIIVNSTKNPEELCLEGKMEVKSVDVTTIAMKVIGRPFVNIAALGAFAALSGEITLKGIEEALKQQMGDKKSVFEKNVLAVKEAYTAAQKCIIGKKC